MKASKAMQELQHIINNEGDLHLKVVVQTGPDSFKLVEVVGFVVGRTLRQVATHIQIGYKI